jgi:phosphoribosylformylglycinamidine (FGAM) synthase-like enzyme
MAIAGDVGLEASLDELVELRGCSGESALFGEGPGGFVLTGERGELERLADEADDVDVLIIGRSGGETISLSAAEAELEVPVAEAQRAWRSLGERLDVVAAGA